MIFYFYIYNFIIIWYSWKRFHDFLNPIFALTSVWTVFTASYDILSRTTSGYRILSDLYYLYAFLFFVVFTLISLFILRNVCKKETYQNRYFCNSINVPLKTINLLITMAIIANIFYVIVLIIATGSINPIIIMSNVRELTRGDNPTILATMIKLPALLFNFTPLILCYVFMFDIKANKRKVAILMIEMFLISFLLATKGRVLRFTLLLIIMLKHKLNRRKFKIVVMIIIPVSLLVMYILVINRDKSYFENYSMADYLFVYFLSPIPGLDRLVCGELNYVTTGFGPRTLEYFYQLFHGIFGTTIPNYVDPGYIRIQTPNGFLTSNVFTGLGLYYLDYGMIGSLICGAFFSFVYTFIYKQMAKYGKTSYAIFYIVNFPYLLFHVFGDLIICSLSITIQEFLTAVIITYFNKKIKIRA